jgi:multiple sugar transport system substrate-binding protein
MKSKKICLLAILLLTVMLSVSYAAPQRKYEGKVISWATHLNYVGIDKLRSLVSIWEKETGAKVNIIILPHPGSAEKVFFDYKAGINTYDLVTLNCLKVGMFVENGLLEPLDSYIHNSKNRDAQINDFIPALLDYYGRWEGKLYGFPLKADGRLMLYRKDIFAKYKRPIPKTWDEFADTAKFFNGKDWNGDKKADFGCAVRFDYDAVAAGRFAEILAGYSGQLFDNKWNPKVNSSESQKTMNKIIEMTKYAPKDTLSLGFTEYTNNYLLNKVPMIVTFNEMAPVAEDVSKSKVVGKTGYAKVPGNRPLLGGFGISMLSTSKQKDVAYDFMTWFTSKKIELQRIAHKGVFIYEPSRTSTYDNAKIVKKYPWFPVAKAGLMNSVGLPRIPETDEIVQVFGQEIRRAANGEISSKNALDNSEDKLTQVLKRSGRLK